MRSDTAAAIGRAIDIAAPGAAATNAPTGIRGLLTENATTETAIDLAAADLLTSIEALNGDADRRMDEIVDRVAKVENTASSVQDDVKEMRPVTDDVKR